MNWVAIVAVLVTLIFFYFIGSIVLWLCGKATKREPFSDAFLRLVIGTTTIATIYAMIITCCDTIMTGFVVIGLLYLILDRRNLHRMSFSDLFKFDKDTIKPLIFFLIVGAFMTVYFGLFYYHEPLNTPFHPDNYIYSYNAYSNQQNGTEVLCYYIPGMANVSLYHYFESWTTALIATVFSINYLETFTIVLMSIWIAILTTGIVAISNRYNSNIFMKIIACCAIFLSAILLSYNPISQAYAMASNHKNLLTAIFLLSFLISVFKESKFYYLWLLCLPIVNVAHAPIIVSSVGLLSLILLCKEKNKKQFAQMVVSALFVAAFILLFYFLQSKPLGTPSSSAGGTAGGGSIAAFISDNYSISNFANMFIRDIIVCYAVYLPYLLPLALLLFIGRKTIAKSFFSEHKIVLIYFIVTLLLGVCCHFMFYPFNKYDSGQLNSNHNLNYMNLLVLISFLYVSAKLKDRGKVTNIMFCCFVALVSIYNVFVYSATIQTKKSKVITDEVYASNIKNYIEENNVNRLGARIIKDVADCDLKVYDKVSDVKSMAKFGTEIDGLAAIALNLYNVPMENNEFDCKNVNCGKTRFGRFAMSNYDGIQNINDIRLDYMRENGLFFLLVPKDLDVPSQIINEADTIFIDRQTGERFVFLKK